MSFAQKLGISVPLVRGVTGSKKLWGDNGVGGEQSETVQLGDVGGGGGALSSPENF